MKPCHRLRIAGRAPLTVRLAAGETLACLQGLAWVTQASAAWRKDRDQAGRDIVLAPRERLHAVAPLTCFVSALHGEPAWIVVSGQAAALPPLHTQPRESIA